MTQACLVTDAGHPATVPISALLAREGCSIALHGFDPGLLDERARTLRACGAGEVIILQDDSRAPRQGLQLAEEARRAIGPVSGCLLAPSRPASWEHLEGITAGQARSSQLQELLFHLGKHLEEARQGWLLNLFPQGAVSPTSPAGMHHWLFSLVSALAVEWKTHAVEVSSLTWPDPWNDWDCEEAALSWAAAARPLMTKGRILGHWRPPSGEGCKNQIEETGHE